MALTIAMQVLILNKLDALESDIRIREICHNRVMSSLSDLNRLLLAGNNSDNAKPMKSNNWDSVKNCFKGPSRVDINERT